METLLSQLALDTAILTQLHRKVTAAARLTEDWRVIHGNAGQHFQF